MFSLTDPDLSDDKTRAALVLSLAQRVAERKTEHAIGFRVYRVRAVLDIYQQILDLSKLRFVVVAFSGNGLC